MSTVELLITEIPQLVVVVIAGGGGGKLGKSTKRNLLSYRLVPLLSVCLGLYFRKSVADGGQEYSSDQDKASLVCGSLTLIESSLP